MKEHFGCDPADILAAVGPSICQDCYEVSGDVIEKFKEAFDEKDWDNLFYRKNNGKYQLDLWKANESVFRESGKFVRVSCIKIKFLLEKHGTGKTEKSRSYRIVKNKR